MRWGPIITGVDASPEAAHAAAVGARIARDAASSCELVHAVRDSWAVLTGVAGARQMQLEEMQRFQLAFSRQQVCDALRSSAPAKLLETLAVRFGTPAAVLKDVARERRAGLIVLCGKHHSAVERWLGGSTSLDVARTAEIPVLVTAQPRDAYRRVLVAVDMSAAAGPTISLAERFAELVGAELRVLTVFEPIPILPGAPPFDPSGYYELSQETLEQEVWPQVCASGVQKFVRHGSIVDTLLREAADWPADVLVVGSHGKNWAQRLLLGSVTERLINCLPTALLVAPVGMAAAALHRRTRELAVASA